MDDHLLINLRVADMLYGLRVKRTEEVVFRKAAKDIDYKLSQYRGYFTNNSQQPLRDIDYMAMTAIQAVAGTAEQELRAGLFEKKLKELTLELDRYLKGE